MVRKKIAFIFKIIAIFIIIMSLNTATSRAADSLGDILSAGDTFIEDGAKAGKSELNEENLRSASSTIFNIVTTIGIIIILIVGLILGIQFMIASTEAKAEIKKSLIPYIVGSVIILGAFGIWKLAIEIFSKL